MKTSVFLLLLAAFTCGLARGEEQAAEEVQVETLVSETPDYVPAIYSCDTAAVAQ